MNNPNNPIPFAVTSIPESAVLEYKETVHSKTYLKTVSAYANYHEGKIKFGISDDGTIRGISNTGQAALDLENQINDNIRPQPNYNISIDTASSVITVTVYKGKNTPYRYNNKAYRRNGTSTIVVDDYELNQLILKGKNVEFCDLPSDRQDLTFEIFSEFWNRLYALPANPDLFATLGSYGEEGYSITAELLSDQNSFPGLSLVQFGSTINQIELRKNFDHQSILKINQESMDMITDLLSYEEITDRYRDLKIKVPVVALRETLVNALVHRDWSIREPIQVEIFPDKLTVLSPGGLPDSMSEEEYLYSNRSIPRNTQLAIIFLRLNLIEKLGTGLRRVRNSYETSFVKPVFKVYPNSILVELPYIQRNPSLNADQSRIVELLRQEGPLKRKRMEEAVGFSQSKTIRILKELMTLGVIEKTNSGPKTEYKLS